MIIKDIVRYALEEDLIFGDITSETLIDADDKCIAYIKTKEQGILSGSEVATIVFQTVDPNILLNFYLKDGSQFKSGTKIAHIKGNTISILKAERVALNFLQHLSGIATLTRKFVDLVHGLPVKISDTRKTTPGLRLLEKKAVTDGGGYNHRFNLGESILIKNNHISALKKRGKSISDIIEDAKQLNRSVKKVIEIEVTTIDDALEAAKKGVDIIMLDNMPASQIREAVKLIKGKAIIEASGGINLENVREIAEAGVDIISIGALTHSARAIDISLTIEQQ